MSRALAKRDETSPEPVASAKPPDRLFRDEVMAEQQTQWLGSVLIAPRLSASLFTLFALCATGALIAMLFLGHYTQKARIAGWLTPEQGMMRVYPPRDGRIAKLDVQEGSEVKAGQPLAVVSTELESETLGRTGAAAIAQLRKRRDSLALERERQGSLSVLQERALSDRLAVLKADQGYLDKELLLQRSRLALADQTRDRVAGLRAKGIATEAASQDAESDRLRISADQQRVERDRLTNARERLDTEARLRELPLEREVKLGEIERETAALAQQVAEAEAAREFVVTAPQDGIVTSVRATAGGGVRAETPLLSIMPTESQLIAELFTTSRAIGFVQPGQSVLMRYQPYPYQKFGTYRGTVTRISRSAVSPAELSPQLAGLTSLFAADEPVYRIEVTPDRQSATAYGRPAPLQAGMQLEADILIERRKLYEWMLDPLFTLTGRWAT